MSTDAIINTYSYIYDTNWKDQLINYNGNTITYDEIGNPLTYGNNITYTWINGRELSTYTDTSNNLEVTYSYNDEGIRTSKLINGVEHKYYLEGTNIIYENIGEDTLYYFYDSTGSIEGFKYNNDLYYYIKNGQNDIIGIIDEQGNKIVSYTYDSWGQIISITDNQDNEITDQTHIGNINPFRYRSYYYDSETELYYLNSRYYNPEMGRFINADGIVGEIGGPILGHNVYQYAFNNPINMEDSDGNWPKWLKKITIGHIAMGVALVAAGMLGGAPLILATATTVLANTMVSGIMSGVMAQKSGANQKQVQEATKNGIVNGYTTSAIISARVNVGGVIYQQASSYVNKRYVLPTGNDTNGIIKGYTYHGDTSVFNHNGGHGVCSKSLVETVKNPRGVKFDPLRETFKYSGTSSNVVLDFGGNVVTAYPKSSSAYRFK